MNPSSNLMLATDPKSVLIVEDDDMVQYALQSMVRKAWGTDVLVRMVDNGRDALHLVADEDFDLILMDNTLPGYLSGIETIAALHQARCTAAIVGTTASGKKMAGAMLTLTKPLSVARLRSLVAETDRCT